MLTLLTIAGGVALILFGARFLRKGLDRLFGNRLERLMQAMSHTRLRAFVAGLLVAVVAPSSTTVSVLAVQTVREGSLPPRRVLPIMLGADIGLTLLVILIALRLDTLAPVLVLIGVGLFQFTQPAVSRGIGQIVLSIGFIFLGIGTISQAAAAVAGNGDVTTLMRIASHYPAGLALLAAVLTVVLQSSTATVGLAIATAGAGVLDVGVLGLAVPVVLGANVGSGVTLLGLGWSKHDTRRLALANLLYKLVVAAGLLMALPWVLWAMDRLPLTVDGRIATAHTGFNVVKAALFLPLIEPSFRLVSRLTPSPPPTDEFGPQYIDNQRIDGVAVALGQARHEVVHVSSIVRSMLDDMWTALAKHDIALARSVQQRDDRVDLLDGKIKQFLTRVVGQDADAQDSADVMAQLRYLNELETIGDIIDRNLADLALKRSREAVWFSNAGWAELDEFYRMVAENVLIAETAFSTRDRDLAQQLIRHKHRINEQERRLRDQHFVRLRTQAPETHESSAVHLDILTHLKRINSCVTHVAYALVDPPATYDPRGEAETLPQAMGLEA